MIDAQQNLHRLFFKAFSNETRLKIIALLQKNPLTVNDIAGRLGFEQSRVSHNLRCLEQCGFVSVSKEGKHRVYAIEEETILPMLKLVDGHVKKYQKRLSSCQVIR